MAALRRGDYTPLLFTPIQGEQTYDEARWLHGHSPMTEKLWDLGACHQKAEHQRIVQDGLIWAELEEVGIVEEFEFIDADEDPNFFFRSSVTTILDVNGTSASAFLIAPQSKVGILQHTILTPLKEYSTGLMEYPATSLARRPSGHANSRPHRRYEHRTQRKALG